MSENYFCNPRTEMLQFVPSTVKECLDVGCGEGTFGQLLQNERDCRVTGVEPDFAACEKAKSKLNNAYNCSIEEFLSGPPRMFDAIVFNDVLEHLPDPWTVLRLSKRFLGKSGVVIASIPNIRYYPALRKIILEKDFPYVSAGIFDKTHLRFFTKKSAVQMFTGCCFTVTRCAGINGITSLKWKLATAMTLGACADILFLQFAIVAVSKGSDPANA